MRLAEWLPIYQRILSDFNFSAEEDLKAARRLAGLLGSRGDHDLAHIRKDFPRTVLICGGAPSLADELASISLDAYVVVADSAASVLLEMDMPVGMIVTDLDGVVEDQMELNRRGATVFAHAHGDNVRAVEKYVPMFSGQLVGTCQCEPPEGLVNFGGFTDGDRAACICAALGADKLLLAGFDFDVPAEKPGRSLDVKKRKLEWARRILGILSEEGVGILDASTERRLF